MRGSRDDALGDPRYKNRMRVGCWICAGMLALGAASCQLAGPHPGATPTTQHSTQAADPGSETDGQQRVAGKIESFRATLRIDDEAGHKGFQGVWLERAGGERLLIAYRPHGYWKPFAGHEVKVTGQRYVPAGEAVMAEHFRVHTLSIDPKKMTDLVRVETERVFEGKVEERTMEPGTKLAGETLTFFVATDGTSYSFVHRLDEMPPVGKSVRVRARVVEPTPFITRLGGPYLWLIEVVP